MVKQQPATCLNHRVVIFRLCCFYNDVKLLAGMCMWGLRRQCVHELMCNMSYKVHWVTCCTHSLTLTYIYTSRFKGSITPIPDNAADINSTCIILQENSLMSLRCPLIFSTLWNLYDTLQVSSCAEWSLSPHLHIPVNSIYILIQKNTAWRWPHGDQTRSWLLITCSEDQNM